MNRKMHMFIPVGRFVLLAMICVGLIGCAHASVRHLNRNAWVANGEQSLEMKYWIFHYQADQEQESVNVSGVAYPKKESIAGWAQWIDKLWMTAYLSDEKGRVLARNLHIFPPQELDYEEGIPFSFELKPNELGSPGPVYITFGYRMVLTPNRLATGEKIGPDSELTSEDDVFPAMEGALIRY